VTGLGRCEEERRKDRRKEKRKNRVVEEVLFEGGVEAGVERVDVDTTCVYADWGALTSTLRGCGRT
jgi:hypothetical protein